MKRAAFTLWQTLAVVVIVSVIVVILFPVFADRGRERNPRLFCASNEKQLGLAIVQYLEDNNERFPNIAAAPGSNPTWRNGIYPYVKSSGVYHCPSREDKFNGPDGLPRSYAANYTGDYSGLKNEYSNGVFAGPGSNPVSLAEIPDPSKLIMLCEFAGGNTPEFNIDSASRFGPDTHLLWAGHDGMSNYLMVDCHVKCFRPLDTKDKWHRDASVPLSPNGMAVLAETEKRARR